MNIEIKIIATNVKGDSIESNEGSGAMILTKPTKPD